jgi:hypothetical protein
VVHVLTFTLSNNNITTFGNLLKQSQVKIKKLIILEDDRFEVVDEVAGNDLIHS